MKKVKKPAFKRGDQLIWLNPLPYMLRLTELTVTATRGTDTVYAKHVTQGGMEFKHVFTDDEAILRLRYAHRLWEIMPHPGKKALKKLERRLNKAAKRYAQYRETVAEIERQVRYEAKIWEDEQYRERIREVPYGGDYVDRVVARAGFRKPRR